jgi:hypothetical protein
MPLSRSPCHKYVTQSQNIQIGRSHVLAAIRVKCSRDTSFHSVGRKLAILRLLEIVVTPSVRILGHCFKISQDYSYTHSFFQFKIKNYRSIRNRINSFMCRWQKNRRITFHQLETKIQVRNPSPNWNGKGRQRNTTRVRHAGMWTVTTGPLPCCWSWLNASNGAAVFYSVVSNHTIGLLIIQGSSTKTAPSHKHTPVHDTLWPAHCSVTCWRTTILLNICPFSTHVDSSVCRYTCNQVRTRSTSSSRQTRWPPWCSKKCWTCWDEQDFIDFKDWTLEWICFKGMKMRLSVVGSVIPPPSLILVLVFPTNRVSVGSITVRRSKVLQPSRK